MFVLRAAKREKSEGDSQYEDEEDEGEEEDETNYTSSREVEKKIFRSERSSTVLLFF